MSQTKISSNKLGLQARKLLLNNLGKIMLIILHASPFALAGVLILNLPIIKNEITAIISLVTSGVFWLLTFQMIAFQIWLLLTQENYKFLSVFSFLKQYSKPLLRASLYLGVIFTIITSLEIGGIILIGNMLDHVRGGGAVIFLFVLMLLIPVIVAIILERLWLTQYRWFDQSMPQLSFNQSLRVSRGYSLRLYWASFRAGIWFILLFAILIGITAEKSVQQTPPLWPSHVTTPQSSELLAVADILSLILFAIMFIIHSITSTLYYYQLKQRLLENKYISPPA